MPDVSRQMGWTWDLVVLGGFSLTIGALMVALQHPIQLTYAAVLDGLSAPQRSEAVRALRRGDSRRSRGDGDRAPCGRPIEGLHTPGI